MSTHIYNQNYIEITGKQTTSFVATLFWMTKPVLIKHIFIVLDGITLLCMSLCTLWKISTASGARKPKLSKANEKKTCWLLKHVFLCLITLLEVALRVICSILKCIVLSLVNGETLIKSTHVCFPQTHPHTITYIDLRVDLPSYVSVKKLIDASFFIDTHARLNISNITYLTKSYQYLNLWSSLKWIAYSLKWIQTHLTSNRENLINKKWGNYKSIFKDGTCLPVILLNNHDFESL